MKFLFFNHDGRNVSGVYSYGTIISSSHPDCLILSLNEYSGIPDEKSSLRLYRIPPEQSHQLPVIVDIIAKIALHYPDEPLILLPNNGEVPFLACLRAVATLKEPRDRLRILAIIHSDHPDSYATAIRHSGHVAQFIGVSAAITDTLRTLLPDRHKDITCLPYPVILPTVRSQTTIDVNEPLRLVYAGRLTEQQKHVSRLVDVAAHLDALAIPFLFDIYGAGDAADSLAKSLNRVPSTNQRKITMKGKVAVEEIRSLMPAYDILLLVSSYEGTPLVLLEGMAAGLCPVVMEIESGVPELIANGVNGLIVPQGDSQGMAEAIAVLHGDRQHLDEMKKAARTWVENNYNLSSHLESLNTILQACVTTPAPRPPSDFSHLEFPIGGILDRVENSPQKEIVIWGGGMFGRSVVDACLDRGITLRAIIDVDTNKQGLIYRGIPYAPPEALTALNPSQVIIGSVAFAPEIYNAIVQTYQQHNTLPPPILRLKEGR